MSSNRLLISLLVSASVVVVNGFTSINIPRSSTSQQQYVISTPVTIINARTSSLSILSSTEEAVTEASSSFNEERERFTIFVGNLPFEISSQEVKEMFESHGTVELVAIPKNKLTDQPRGFAFVDMSSEAELQAAIAAVDGMEFNNRKIRAMKSVPPEQREARPEREPRERRTNATPRYEDPNVKKLYVGNLPFEATKSDLQEFYSQYGNVLDVFVPQNVNTGKGRGFAFVSFNEADSQIALDTTNGMEFQGRTLVVNRPLPQGERSAAPRGGGNRRDDDGERGNRTKLYIGNLSFYTVADTLKEIFEEFGSVHDCYLPEDPNTGSTRGFGFVTMSKDDAANAIAELDGCEVDGRTIRVNEAKPKGGFTPSNDE